MNRWHWLFMSILLLAVTATGLGLVYLRQESRTLFVTQQELHRIRDNAEIDWGRLQIEQATLADIARIERVAREQLGMYEPSTARVIVASSHAATNDGGRQ